MQCQEYRLVSGDDGHLVKHRCRKAATATIEGVNLCTVHLGSLFVYGKSWFLRDDETYELTLTSGPKYPLTQQEERP